MMGMDFEFSFVNRVGMILRDVTMRFQRQLMWRKFALI